MYLPEAQEGWFDFWTGEVTPGGQAVSVSAPMEQIPLHVRAGSILPLGPALQYTGEKPADPIELRIYPGADADYVLYEDEGTNYAYERGARATIPLYLDDARQRLTLGARQGSFPGMLKDRTFRITWVRPGHGVGDAATAAPDIVVQYHGEPLTVPRP